MQPVQQMSYFADRPGRGSLALGAMAGLGGIIAVMAVYLLLPFLSTGAIVAIAAIIFMLALLQLYRLQRGATELGDPTLELTEDVNEALSEEELARQERLGNLHALEQRVKSLEEELIVWPRRRSVVKWLQIATQLGDTFLTLGYEQIAVHGQTMTRESSQNLKQALGFLRKAAASCPVEKAPLAWARIQFRIGRAALLRGRQQGSVTGLTEAVSAFSAAIPIFEAYEMAEEAAQAQEGLSDANRALQEATNEPEEEISDDIL